MTTASTLATLSDPLKENSHSDPSASSLLRATFAGVCGSLSLLLGAGANAQESDVALQAGFVPDPYSRIVTIGGSDSAASFDASCSGFIDSDAPGLIFDYDSLDQAGKLGIFVDADIDTTLVVIAPDGDVYCNDDSPDLAFGNPGLEIDNADSGQYRIMVGGHETTETDEEATLVVTEYGAAMWMVLDLDAGFDSLILSMVETDIEFGDDSGDWANDGECDDPRFEGPGAASFTSESSEMHDANDCRSMYEAGRVTLVPGTGVVGAASSSSSQPTGNSRSNEPAAPPEDSYTIGVPRGDINGATQSDGSIYASGTVYGEAINAGDRGLSFMPDTTSYAPTPTRPEPEIDFGDDSSVFANDGECDDPRFEGEGMAFASFDEYLARDASDCRTAFEAGTITLIREDQPR